MLLRAHHADIWDVSRVYCASGKENQVESYMPMVEGTLDGSTDYTFADRGR